MKQALTAIAALGLGAVLGGLVLAVGIYCVTRWGDCALADFGPDGDAA